MNLWFTTPKHLHFAAFGKSLTLHAEPIPLRFPVLTPSLPLLRAGAAMLAFAGGFLPSVCGADEAVKNAKVEEMRREEKVAADVFALMRVDFLPEKARGMHARFQFKISGPNGGNWWLIVNDGKMRLERGTIEAPDVTISASDRDWVLLSQGNLNGAIAYLTGRLGVKGDSDLAHKLDDLYP